MEPERATRPFEGLRVVDASRVLAGPFCCQMLADMGADVIKIESPEGDENRRWPPVMANGVSCNYASVNRGKRGITLDLKSEAAGGILDRLVARADVVVHSFLPGTARRLGLDAGELRARHPRLIVCSISGYGTEGPLADKPGYDLMVQALGGAMSVTGHEDGPPVRTGVSFVDMSTGLSAYGAIATALFERTRTGEGAWVRASLLETLVAELGMTSSCPVRSDSWGMFESPTKRRAKASTPDPSGSKTRRWILAKPNGGSNRRLIYIPGSTMNSSLIPSLEPKRVAKSHFIWSVTAAKSMYSFNSEA